MVSVSDMMVLIWFLEYRGPLYNMVEHGLTLITAWISHYIHYKVWDEIIYPFLNFNDATVEVYEKDK